MNARDAIIGTVFTVIIGGTAYTINQSDVVNNFADDTGLTQQQAEQYIDDIGEEDLVSFGKIGTDYIEEGEDWLETVSEIDCINYTYEWESSSLSCDEGKEQMDKIGNDAILLGRSYIKFDSDSASEEDMARTVSLIDVINVDYDFSIVSIFYDDSDIDDWKKTNSYNRAIIETVLDSN
jgi:hypothetical protein